MKASSVGERKGFVVGGRARRPNPRKPQLTHVTDARRHTDHGLQQQANTAGSSRQTDRQTQANRLET